MDLEKLLRVAIRGGASDVLLKTGAVPRFRFQGSLVSLSDGKIVSEDMMRQWLEAIVPARLKDRLASLRDLDFGYQIDEGARFRINVFRQRQSFGMVLRIVPSHIRTLEELQLPKILHQLCEIPRGLILVTGITGSGKSTTLAAMLHRINRDQAKHIITIEDPIEYSFTDDRSTINQREVGVDAESFEVALRSALRQNPDVIFVGELRDKETIETALMAAETGHLVLSTMHTSDAPETLTRTLSYFPPHQHPALRMILSVALQAVISQRLVPRADGKGMVAACEVMTASATVREQLLSGEDFKMLRDAITAGGMQYGMQSFDQALIDLFTRGMITREQALAQASNKDDLLLALNGIAA